MKSKTNESAIISCNLLLKLHMKARVIMDSVNGPIFWIYLIKPVNRKERLQFYHSGEEFLS